MRILHVTPYYTPAYAFGGVVRSVEGMTHALARRGHEVTVLTTDTLDSSNRIPIMQCSHENVQVVRVANFSVWLRGHANLSTPFGMRGAANKLVRNADIIHCHEFRTAENLIVTPIAEHGSKPLVLSPHGTLNRGTGRSQLKAAWDRLLSPTLARRFDHVIGLTDAEVSEVRVLWNEFGAQSGFSTIPNGVDPEAYAALPGRQLFRERYGLGDALVCLFMGRLHPRKGVGLLVEAFKAANVPGARLVIAGPDEGMHASLDAQADERIILTGFLGGDDRLAALAAADCLALPAVGEGLPMVVLEAMASGLPVIVSPECHLPEVAQYGAGIQVEPQLEPLRAALRRLLADADLRATMGKAARALVENRFTWDLAAKQLESLYQQLVTQP